MLCPNGPSGTAIPRRVTLVRAAQFAGGTKPRAQLTGQLVDPRLRFRIRKEREEIAGRTAAFARPKLSPTIEVENELHDRIVEQKKNTSSKGCPAKIATLPVTPTTLPALERYRPRV